MKGAILLAIVSAVCVFGHGSIEHLNPSGHLFREYSLQKPYLSSGLTMNGWDFQGNTVITEDYVRLTPDRQSKRGSIWTKKPLNLDAWEATIHFKVHGQGKHLAGDGFAIWYTKNSNILGSVFGSMDQFVGLGVFFDTYSNHKGHSHGHPYISAAIGDGALVYDHDQDGTHSEMGGCQAFIRNLDHDSHVRLVYRNNILKVLLDVKNNHEWETCMVAKDVYLPRGYYLGVSAATGDLADNHDIISIKVSEPAPLTEEERKEINEFAKRAPLDGHGGHAHDEPAAPTEPAQAEKPFAKHHAEPREHKGDVKPNVFKLKADAFKEAMKKQRDEDSSWGITTYFFIVLVVVVIAALGFVVFQAFTQKKSNRFTY